MLTIALPNAEIEVELRVPGEHNVMKRLPPPPPPSRSTSAIAASSRAWRASAASRPPAKKAACMAAPSFDDTYNANPRFGQGRTGGAGAAARQEAAGAGDMGELGRDAAAMHAQIGLAARAAGGSDSWCWAN